MDYDGQGASSSPTWAPSPFRRACLPTTIASRLPRWDAGAGPFACIRWCWAAGQLPFPGGDNVFFPAWSSDGAKLAFSDSRSGDPEIYLRCNGGSLKQITTFRGPMFRPTWNPKTNSQIAWCSGRTGLPQIYIMDSDGTNVQRMTDGGYATSPSWSPTGSFWSLPGTASTVRARPAGRTSTSWILPASAGPSSRTTRGGRISLPGRRMGGTSYSNAKRGGSEIWTMLSDGTEQHRLTQEQRKFDAQLELEIIFVLTAPPASLALQAETSLSPENKLRKN
jgi:TolB protein